MGLFSRQPKPDPGDAIRLLRDQALTVEPAALGLAPTSARPLAWGVLMETGYPEAAATLVVFADGTTSMYFSNGGGVIGAGEHPPVRAAGETLLSLLESRLSHFAIVPLADLPRDGRVRFIIRTFGVTVAAEAAEADLSAGTHPLSDLFFAAQDVITAIREASPAE